MAIQRIHFRERYPLPRNAAGIQAAIGRLLVGNALNETVVESTFLQPGIYDLTPPVWLRYGSNDRAYAVQVLDNGTGVFMRVPNQPDAMAQVMTSGFSAQVPGLEAYPLDGTTVFATVMGGDPEVPPSPNILAYLFELVAYREDAPGSLAAVQPGAI